MTLRQPLFAVALQMLLLLKGFQSAVVQDADDEDSSVECWPEKAKSVDAGLNKPHPFDHDGR